jgi:serine/threonine protein kinase
VDNQRIDCGLGILKLSCLVLMMPSNPEDRSLLSPLLNQVLGDRYLLQTQISRKPGRQTFLALDTQIQQTVFLKLLTFGDLGWEDVKLFEREAEVLRTLEHSQIPKYLDYFEVDTPPTKGFALVQTYIAVRSLEEHLKAGRTFTEAELKELARQVLMILTYLHDRTPPVIHRDIKPSNILLENRSAHSIGQVYLVDFGAVQTLVPQGGQTFTVVGTYGYMPMEQFGGRTVPASDLYGLGATLVRVATGQDPAELPQENMRLNFESLVQVSPELIVWLQQMLEPDLGKRYQDAQAALVGLDRPSLSHEFSPILQRQPSNSILKVTVQKSVLRIEHPAVGQNPQTFLNPIFVGFGVLPLVFPVLSAISMTVGVRWGIGVSIIFVVMAFLLLCSSFLMLWNQCLYITIDDEVLCAHTKTLGGFELGSRTAVRDRVTKIEVVHNVAAQGGNVTTNPHIIILGGGVPIVIQNLELKEADWLGMVLQEWLDVPLKQVGFQRHESSP